MATKVLFDTDIGSDIDDAACLAYLLAQPECDLLGITTVSGGAGQRAMLASALCRAAGRDIPIFPGAERPLLGPQRQPAVPQTEALEKWQHERDFPRGEAVDFLRRTVREHPGEVTLLAVGPLTNLALLFGSDPEIPSLLGSLVIMNGLFASRPAGASPVEWNAGCDPHAAAMVYASPVSRFRSVGLDVTCRVRMESSKVRQEFRHGLLRPVLDFAEIWFERRDIITFHDPLAAATVFDRDICGFEKGNVEVEVLSRHAAGMTHWTPDASGRHEVALTVDSERFFAHYVSTLSRHASAQTRSATTQLPQR